MARKKKQLIPNEEIISTRYGLVLSTGEVWRGHLRVDPERLIDEYLNVCSHEAVTPDTGSAVVEFEYRELLVPVKHYDPAAEQSRLDALRAKALAAKDKAEVLRAALFQKNLKENSDGSS